MKFCVKCGSEIMEESVICPKCGCMVDGKLQNKSNGSSSGLQTAVKVFMILGCISMAWFFLIPLAWCIPMTVHYFNCIRDGKEISVGFKVCSLLFVSLIGGILMLCDKND